MRIIAFIQDEHSIKDIMKVQEIPDFQAPPPIPKFIDTTEAIENARLKRVVADLTLDKVILRDVIAKKL